MISVVDLRKSFTAPNGSRIEVLRGVTFSAQAGECIAITGASGSGKSTLLHLLGGLDTQNHGTIEWRHSNARQPAIGFVFQFHYLLPDLSAIENVALPLLSARCRRDRAIERSLRLLKDVGLDDRADHPVSHLSGGEQQRVALARAFVHEPRILFADEPTGNLDAGTGESIIQLMEELNRERGTTLVLVTHDPALAKRARRTIRLADGVVVSDTAAAA
jgi:ABC-type lipoprotein export system ATPase subunit